MSVDDRGSDCENKIQNRKQNKQNCEDNRKRVQEGESVGYSGIVNHKQATITESGQAQLNYSSKGQSIEESVEDSEVREINSEKCKEEGSTMGKSSHGLKALANLGSVLLKRGAADGRSEVKTAEFGEVCVLPIGTSIYSDSPAAKTFHQVKLGEYANFQDDLMPWDMDCPVTKAMKNNQDTVKEQIFTDEEKKHVDQTAEKLNKTAQDQLEALYDSIDNCELVSKITKSPKSLSQLCESILGLHRTSKKRERGTSLNVEVANHLKLSSKDQKDPCRQTVLEDGPNYANEPEESPFYNYESIMFGKNGNIEQICGVCRKHFSDIDSLLRHHSKKHPAVQFSFLQIEQGHEIEDLHFSEPSTVGALAVTDPGLDNVAEMDSFRCTNCSAVFKNVSRLHIHMVNCSSIDPIFGVQKVEISQTRTPLKRKLQKKIFSLFGNKTDATNELNSLSFRLSQQRNETQSPKRVFTGCRKRTSFILPDSPQKLISEQKPLMLTSSGYNPQNHVRRRELTEILDTLTCEACGLKFKTIILLERHVKYCTKKEKFKSIQPMACPLIDESLEKIKNMCLYCNKNFTYTKSLVNHFQDFCPVKRAKLDKGELTEQDKMKEAEIIERIQKGEEVKAVKQKDMENRPRRNVSWQVGRKSKRKGHSWTNIKKRNQQKQSVAGTEAVEESDNNEGYESSGSESGIEGNKMTASDVDNSDSKIKEPLIYTTSDALDTVKISDSNTSDKVINETNNAENYGEENQGELSDKDGVGYTSKDKNSSSKRILEEKSHLEVPLIQEVLQAGAVSTALAVVTEVKQPSDITSPVAVLPDCLSPIGNTSINSSDLSLSEKDGPLTLYTCIDVNNTSLNCTARYSVNVVNPVKKYRPIAPKPKSSSSMFQCVSKLIPTSKPLIVGSEKSLPKDNVAAFGNGSNIKSPPETEFDSKEEAKFKLAEQGLITGKRKRARVGRVEEFLRNAFKRKKNKLERKLYTGENNSSLDAANQGCQENSCSINDRVKSSSNCLEKSKGVDGDTAKLSIGDASYLKCKQAEENTLNKISQVVLSKKKHLEDKIIPESSEMELKMPSMSNLSIDVYVDEQQQIQDKCQLSTDKGKLNNESSSINSKQKRGRGRPKGSGMKKTNENKSKPLPGRKRGRPRKFSLPETSNIVNERICNSDHLVSKNDDFSADKEIDTTNELDNLVESDSGVETCSKHLERDKDFIFSQVKVSKKDENLQQDDATESCREVCESVTGNTDGSDHNSSNGNSLTICAGYKTDYEINGRPSMEAEVDDKIVHVVSNKSLKPSDEIVCDQIYQRSTIQKDASLTNTEKDGHIIKIPGKDYEIENAIKLKHFEKIDKLDPKQHCLTDYEIKCKVDSYDEVDGCFAENTEGLTEIKSDNSDVTNYTNIKFISEQIVEKASEKLPFCVLPIKDDQDKACKGNLGKTSCGSNSLENERDHVNSRAEYDQEHSCENISKGPDEEDLYDKELNNEQIKIAIKGNINDNTSTKVFSPESETNTTSELDILLEPVLSPGERVKMNKRSCKKDVDLSSPVWVKRTKLHKGKSEKKLDDSSNDVETYRKTQNKTQMVNDFVVENRCTKTVGKSDDYNLGIARKRKNTELDIDNAPKLKHHRQDDVKGNVKINIRSKN